MFVIAICVSVGCAVVPLTFLRTLLGIRFVLKGAGFKVAHDTENDYYKAQHMWSPEMKYHKDHFLYKRLPPSKNPEILTPDQDSAVGADDIKSYGAVPKAVEEGADDITLKGGLRVASPRRGDSDVEAPAPSPYGAVSPSTYGATSAEVVTPPAPAPGPKKYGAVAVSPAVAEPATAKAPEAAVDPVPEPAPAPSAPPATTRPPAAASVRASWEFEVKAGHEAFGGDCQKYIEDSFAKFKTSGGRSRINAKTDVDGKEVVVSIDFEKMTSKIEKSRVRKIRRNPPWE